jgi:hypothetical protein
MVVVCAILLQGTVAPGGMQDEKAFQEQLDSIVSFLKEAKTAEEHRAALGDLLMLARSAQEAECHGTAAKAYEWADKCARQIKDAGARADVQQKAAEAKAAAAEYGKAKSAFSRLESAPDDPAAHLAAGRYLCLARGDWEKGIPHLAKSSDETLKALCTAEASADGTPESLLATGDKWWTYAERNPPFRARATEWYRRAWPQLSGVAREKVRAKFIAMDLRPKGKVLERAPSAWHHVLDPGTKSGGLAIDETFAHGGSSSFRITPHPGEGLVTQVWECADNRE